MTEIIINPFYDNFLELSAKSKTNIKLCAPYVKADMVKEILNQKKDCVSVDLITKVDLKNYHSKVSDLDSLQQTLLYEGRVFNCSNLHAKIYIFDNCQCVITSANLTASGLKRNAEFGILTNDMNIVNSTLGFYNHIITRDDVSAITNKKVEEINDLLKKIPPIPSIKYPRIDFADSLDNSLSIIYDNLSGWKKDVFMSLTQFDKIFPPLR